MAIITLTTDLGIKDSFLATIKGTIYSQLENVRIVDISNQIDPYNINQAAFIVRNCFNDFPKGTVHIISVDDELSIENEHVAVESNGHYFIGADNGFFTILFNDIRPDKIVKLNISISSNCFTFASKNIFVPAACHLVRGGTLEIIGTPIKEFEVKRILLKAVIQKDMIRGAVVHVDNYGNAITNITKNEFEQARKDRSFLIVFGREDEMISELSNKYKDVPSSEKLAIFGVNNQLQIAINKGKASNLLGLRLHEVIRIEFK
jgi:hypothetical protein